MYPATKIMETMQSALGNSTPHISLWLEETDKKLHVHGTALTNLTNSEFKTRLRNSKSKMIDNSPGKGIKVDSSYRGRPSIDVRAAIYASKDANLKLSMFPKGTKRHAATQALKTLGTKLHKRNWNNFKRHYKNSDKA